MAKHVTYEGAEYTLILTVGVLEIKQGQEWIAREIPVHENDRELTNTFAISLVAAALAGRKIGVYVGKDEAISAVERDM